MLYGVHSVLAMATHTPELTLSEEEAKLQAEATAKLMAAFDTVIDPRTAAIFTFASVNAGIYIPRAIAIKMRREQEARETPADATGQGVAGIYTGEGMAAGTVPFGVGIVPPSGSVQ